jgi:hypothetical protein
MSTIPVRKRRPRSEEEIDETIDESFPASDPPSYSRTARSGAPPRGAKIKRVPGEDQEDGDGARQDQSERKDETT